MKNLITCLVIGVLGGWQMASAADIVGTVTLEGTPPPEVSYAPLMDNPSFKGMYTNTPTTHFYEVGPNHELGDVIVYLKNVNKSTGSGQPPAVLDQKGGLYYPQIMAIQTGQKLLVKNSDDCLHNVDVQPIVTGDPASNQMQPPGSGALTYTFPKPEMFVTFKCDIHPWMFAWVSVMSSPYYDVSSKEGKFVIKNVPPGTYTIAAAHRKLGTLTKEVTVGDDKTATVNFTFKVK